jgi:2-polyprenyl-3-methyl-5-hydroxy-6-metoxy-1,4-benzoquinol methylase
LIPERLVPGTPEWELYHHEHEQRYRFFAERYAGLDVLDAACGVGYGSALIAGCGAKSVTGVDIDPEAVAYADKHFGRAGTSYAVTPVEQLRSLGKTFDLVVSFETIEHVREPKVFLREVASVLRPGGRFICSTPNLDFAGKDADYANPYHLSEMSFADFSAAFREHFTLDEQYHQSHAEAYRRHVQLVRELDRVAKAVRFSVFLRLENWLRRLLGKEGWRTDAPAADLGRAVPGDYVIERLDQPLDRHLTFILLGHAKP